MWFAYDHLWHLSKKKKKKPKGALVFTPKRAAALQALPSPYNSSTHLSTKQNVTVGNFQGLILALFLPDLNI